MTLLVENQLCSVKSKDGRYFIASKGMERNEMSSTSAVDVQETAATKSVDSGGLSECSYLKKGLKCYWTWKLSNLMILQLWMKPRKLAIAK